MESRRSIYMLGGATLFLFACVVFFSSTQQGIYLILPSNNITASSTSSDSKTKKKKNNNIGFDSHSLDEPVKQHQTTVSEAPAAKSPTAVGKVRSATETRPPASPRDPVPARQTKYQVFTKDCQCSAPTDNAFYPYNNGSPVNISEPHPNRAELLNTLLDLTASNRKRMLEKADKVTLCSNDENTTTSANRTNLAASPLRVMLMGDSLTRYLFSAFANRVVSDFGVRAGNSKGGYDPLWTKGTAGKMYRALRWPPPEVPLHPESNVSKSLFEGSTIVSKCSKSDADTRNASFPPSPISLRYESEMFFSFGKKLDTNAIVKFNPTHIVVNRGLWDFARLRMNSPRRSMLSFATGLVSLRKRVDVAVPIFVYGVHKVLGEWAARTCPQSTHNDVFYCAVRYANAMLQREEEEAEGKATGQRQEKSSLGRIYYLDSYSITRDYPVNDKHGFQPDGVHFVGGGLERILDEMLASMVEVERTIEDSLARNAPAAPNVMRQEVARGLAQLPRRSAIQNNTILHYPMQEGTTSDCMSAFTNHAEFERQLELEITPRNVSRVGASLLGSSTSPCSLDFQSGRQLGMVLFQGTVPRVVAALARLDAVQRNESMKVPTHVGYLPSFTSSPVSSEFERAVASAATFCSQFVYNTQTIAGAHEELLSDVRCESEELPRTNKPATTVFEQYERNAKLLKHYSRDQVPEPTKHLPLLDRCALVLNTMISDDLFRRVILPTANPAVRFSCHDVTFIQGFQTAPALGHEIAMSDDDALHCFEANMYKDPGFKRHALKYVHDVRTDNPQLSDNSSSTATANASEVETKLPPKPNIRHCPSLITNVIMMGPLFRHTPITEEYLFEGDTKYSTFETVFIWCVDAMVRVGLEDSFAGLRYIHRKQHLQQKRNENPPVPRALEVAEWNQHTCVGALEILRTTFKLERNTTALMAFMLGRSDQDGARVTVAGEGSYPVETLNHSSIVLLSMRNFRSYFLSVQQRAPFNCKHLVT